jgi:chromate reductase, NAD(P)H dehydrogenase (quinone)
MIKILGISGSLRRGSFNTALLRAAGEQRPPDVELTVATLHGIPLYDGDVEAQGIPPAVKDLKEAIIQSNGLLLCTPEYNNSIPGVFKNAIDWLSRPPAEIPKVFGAKRVAIMGASIGPFGTLLSQNGWLPVLKVLGTRPWFGGRLVVSHANNVFDANGALTDEKVKGDVQKFLNGFVEYVRSG